MIVGSTHRISWSVRELQLDVFVYVTLFMEQRGGKSAKAVSRHSSLESHPFETFENGVVAHMFRDASLSGEEPLGVPGERT